MVTERILFSNMRWPYSEYACFNCYMWSVYSVLLFSPHYKEESKYGVGAPWLIVESASSMQRLQLASAIFSCCECRHRIHDPSKKNFKFRQVCYAYELFCIYLCCIYSHTQWVCTVHSTDLSRLVLYIGMDCFAINRFCREETDFPPYNITIYTLHCIIDRLDRICF